LELIIKNKITLEVEALEWLKMDCKFGVVIYAHTDKSKWGVYLDHQLLYVLHDDHKNVGKFERQCDAKACAALIERGRG